MIHNPVYILAVLFFLIFSSEWLCKHTRLKHFSSSLLVIILGAILANFGIIPSASNVSPVYEGIFEYVAPASIFFLLLGVNLAQLKKAGVPMLVAFLLGSVGTVLGTLIALKAIDPLDVFGENYAVISGMMVGTYTGGSANFNAVALHYDMLKEGAMYTGLVVADNIMTALWMMITLSIPVLMKKIRPNPEIREVGGDFPENHEETQPMHPISLGLLLFMCAGTLWVSNEISLLSGEFGIQVPSILILSSIALILAHVKAVQAIPGAKMLGMFSVYLFLVVVGAFCELTALIDVGESALDILLFVGLIVIIQGVFLIGFGWFFRKDWAVIAIASQANIGGASSALALAKSLNRNDLLLPAILVGSLGSALGTYLGFLMVGFL